jgi:hypothetical protein
MDKDSLLDYFFPAPTMVAGMTPLLGTIKVSRQGNFTCVKPCPAPLTIYPLPRNISELADSLTMNFLKH